MHARQQLLIRPKPLPDELLSSWLVRLAWENGRKLQPFTVRALGLPRNFWYADLDRSVHPEDITKISEISGVDPSLVKDTTLTSLLERFLTEEAVHSRGPTPWVLPIAPRGRRWHRPGMQLCPECLATDEIPYFRKQWRLAFITVCPVHGNLMVDRCHRCFRPINFHRGDYRLQVPPEEFPWVFCPECGADWRTAPRNSTIIEAVNLGRQLLGVAEEQWMQIGTRRVQAIPAYAGLHVLCRMVASNRRSRRFAIAVAEGAGVLPFATEFPTHHEFFEEIEVDERARVLQLVAWLLNGWPERFVWAGRKAKLSRAYIRATVNDLPYWLSVEVEWDLDGWYYSPTQEERACVVDFLNQNEMTTAENNIRRWLGMSHTLRHKEKTAGANLNT